MSNDIRPEEVARHRRRLFLLRHGAVDYRPAIRGEISADDVPLTTEGQEQAVQVGQSLKGLPFDLIAHSGLERTMQTAELATGVPRAAMMREPRIREIHLGNLSMMTLSEKLERLAWNFDHAPRPGARYAIGESFVECRDRVVEGFEALLAEEWTTALIAAHEVVNRIILSHWVGAGLHGIGAFDQRFCAVNIIDFDSRNDTIVFRAINAGTAHFLPEESRLIAMEHLIFDLAETRSLKSPSSI